MIIPIRISNVLKSNYSIIYKIIIGVVFWYVIIFSGKIIRYNQDFQHPSYSDSNFKVLGLNLPKNLSFAGELVPQDDYRIKESLEKEFITNKSWKSTSKLLFAKSQKWFPIIEEILKQEKVPEDFKYVAMIESHLSNIVSPMGAAGFWQLMPSTARNYGLTVNDEIDERLDIEKSTRVACKLIKEAYKNFNNWTISAAAYNVGIGSIKKSMAKQQSTNYYDLLLNKETGTFVYRILAFKTLLSNPDHFGITHQKKSKQVYPKFNIVKVDSSINNLNYFAKALNTNLVTLKTFNAWIIGDKINNNEHKMLEFKIPKNKNIDISVYFNDVYPQNASNDNTLKITNLTDTLKNITDTLK